MKLILSAATILLFVCASLALTPEEEDEVFKSYLVLDEKSKLWRTFSDIFVNRKTSIFVYPDQALTREKLKQMC